MGKMLHGSSEFAGDFGSLHDPQVQHKRTGAVEIPGAVRGAPAIPDYLPRFIGGPMSIPMPFAFSNVNGWSTQSSGVIIGALRDAALQGLGETLSGRTLQIACAYGDISMRSRPQGARRRWRARHRRRPARAAAEPDEKIAVECDSGLAADGFVPRWICRRQFRSRGVVPAVARTAGVVAPADAGGGLSGRETGRSDRHRRLCASGGLESDALSLPARAREAASHSRSICGDTDLANWMPAALGRAERQRSSYFGGLYQLIAIER